MNIMLKAGEKLTVSFEDASREMEVSYFEKEEFEEPRIKVEMPEHRGSKGIEYYETFPKVDV